ncbi:hypothetical protein J7M07_07815 [bacterium]|nr:hypothetical protein [bacterium]
MNKVVARYADGRMAKGTTADFFPTKDLFHVSLVDAPEGTKPVEVNTKDLKALFFVKSFEGDSQHVERKTFDPERPPAGRRIKVLFKDGEVLTGTTTGYQPKRSGFFLVPVDVASNIERCYVIVEATREIGFI